jgi:hypothetical protein
MSHLLLNRSLQQDRATSQCKAFALLVLAFREAEPRGLGLAQENALLPFDLPWNTIPLRVMFFFKKRTKNISSARPLASASAFVFNLPRSGTAGSGAGPRKRHNNIPRGSGKYETPG